MNVVFEGIGDFLSKHGLVLIIIGAALYVGYLKAGWDAEKEISSIRLEQAQTIAKTNEYENTTIPNLQAKINDIEAKFTTVNQALTAAKANEQAALDRVGQIQEAKVVEKFTIQMIREDADVVKAFGEVYPELSHAKNMGVVDVDIDGLTLQYFTLPVTFIEAFIIDANELKLANEQLQEYGGITEIRNTIDELHDDKAGLLRRVARYEAEKFTACEGVRKDMTTTLLERQDAHIATLEKPRIDLGNKWVLASGIVAGGLAGWFIGDQMCDSGGNVIHLQGEF